MATFDWKHKTNFESERKLAWLLQLIPLRHLVSVKIMQVWELTAQFFLHELSWDICGVFVMVSFPSISFSSFSFNGC